MNWKPLLALLCSAATAWARQGAVETRDGKIYEGAIRFLPQAVSVANAARSFIIQVPTTNVLEMSFKAEEEEPIFAHPWDVTSEDGNLPFPWKKDDVGNGRVRGNAEMIGSVLRLYSGGRGFVEGEDACHFVFKRVSGDSEVMVRVIQIQRDDSNARAGLMMRESLGAGARHVGLALTVGHGGQFTWREKDAVPMQASAHPDLIAPYWIKLRRDGDTFTGFKSVQGRNWTLLHQLTIPMAPDIYVGVAAAGFGEDFVSRAILDNFREAPSLPVTSFVPVVQLLSGSTLTGRVAGLTDDGLFLSGFPNRGPIAPRLIANVLFQWLPSRWTGLLNSGKKGVLLTSGEFVEGEFMGVERGKVIISSVLFGIKFYRMDEDLIALVMQKPIKTKQSIEVRTTDGCAWIGTGLEIADNEIVLREAALGKHSIPLYELASVWCSR